MFKTVTDIFKINIFKIFQISFVIKFSATTTSVINFSHHKAQYNGSQNQNVPLIWRKLLFALSHAHTVEIKVRLLVYSNRRPFWKILEGKPKYISSSFDMERSWDWTLSVVFIYISCLLWLLALYYRETKDDEHYMKLATGSFY